mmetsp:Transcript_19888/g.54847  ORF Transcript_19888/g.54847 Transcript_19888/m.54847 type:complete len:124 (+) Transcript_19888:631-1002(+)
MAVSSKLSSTMLLEIRLSIFVGHLPCWMKDLNYLRKNLSTTAIFTWNAGGEAVASNKHHHHHLHRHFDACISFRYTANSLHSHYILKVALQNLVLERYIVFSANGQWRHSCRSKATFNLARLE